MEFTPWLKAIWKAKVFSAPELARKNSEFFLSGAAHHKEKGVVHVVLEIWEPEIRALRPKWLIWTVIWTDH